MSPIIRVLICKLGLDGHDRGALVVSMALKDAGMEVIYTGLHQTPERVVRVAEQEAVDVIGVSSMVDAHMTFIPELMEELKKANLNIPVILGGLIPPADIPELKTLGVVEVFNVGSRMDEMVESIKALVASSARS